MSNTNLPLVSILIPCHNAEQWVGRAIESALEQTWPNKEVLVVDDGSTDESLEVIQSFGNRIVWASGPNRGANVARNRLLEMARGEWVQYLDADDYLCEEKIAGQIASIPHLDSVDLVYSPMTLEFWNSGYAVCRVHLPIPSPHDPWILLARWSMPGTHAVLMRRSVINDVGGWAPEQPCCQEHELFFRLLAAEKRFVYSPRPGAIYRQWSNSTICTKNPLRTLENRLIIVDRMAAHLKRAGQLTPERALAIATGHMECARVLYQHNEQVAVRRAASAREICPKLRLRPSRSFPRTYRIAYQAFGFGVAEKLASTTRRLRSMIHQLRAKPTPVISPPVLINSAEFRAIEAPRSAATEPTEEVVIRPISRSKRVSILIPCFNASHWIEHAIRSALAQTWTNKEIIVVDDGSTDGSADVIRSFGADIRYEIAPHQGGNAARNRLMELAGGDWLQYLDADDYLLPEKIERQMNDLSDPPWVDVVYSPVILEHWDQQRPIRYETVPIVSSDLWINLILWLLPQTGAALWRRSAVIDVGGWKIDQPCCQEHELYSRLLKGNKYFRFSPTPGAVYRQWSPQTVCRKNPLRTALKRLEIVDAAEEYLSKTDGLTADRRDAISWARMETARTLYQLDRAAALRVASTAEMAHPKHRLPEKSCFPLAYRLAYRVGGFRSAETIAAASRSWRKRTRKIAGDYGFGRSSSSESESELMSYSSS